MSIILRSVPAAIALSAAACLATTASATVSYTTATRTVKAGPPSSPATFTATDFAVFSHTASLASGFSPPCTASMNSTLQSDRITYAGRVSASGDHSGGIDFYGTAVASQSIVISLDSPATIWLDGSWTFVQGFSSNINSSAQVRPVGGAAQAIPSGEVTALTLPAGNYQIDTSMSSNAGPPSITATADYSYSIRFGAPCPVDFDHSGSVAVQDIFDFLNAWFAADPAADFNGSGLSTSDIFDFLNAWFVGC